MNYENLAKKIISEVGGEENVNHVYHCATRLRFTLNNRNLANKKEVESLDGVISVIEAGGMFQVVIGNSVNDVYAAIINVSNLGTSTSTSETPAGKKNLLNAFMEMIAAVFAPTLGVLAGSGLIKGLLALFTSLNWMTVDSGTYIILNAASDAFFYFLPIFLAYTAAKRFKADVFIAMVIGASLAYPSIVNAFNDGVSLSFLGLPVTLARYTNTVIPAILAVYVLSILERNLRKRFHESVRNLLTPFICIIVMVPVTLMVVGPIADYASQIIANGYLAIFNFSPLLSGAVIGGFWQVFVIFGLHWGMVPVMTNNLAIFGRDTLGPGCMMAVASQAGAVLGVFLKAKDKKVKSLALSAFVTALFGVTEPAVYGITLKYKKPFYIACVTGAIFGGIVGAAGSAALAVATRSILSFPIYIGQGFRWLVAGYFMSMITSCILTFLFGYKDEEIADLEKELASNKAGEVILETTTKDKAVDLDQGLAV